MKLFKLFIKQAYASAPQGITNPVIGSLGDDPTKAESGTTFTAYIINIWNAINTVAALLVLLYFIWGAIEWITSGDDKGKTEKARTRITQAVMGLVVLIGAYVIINFISLLFFGEDFSILNLRFPTPN